MSMYVQPSIVQIFISISKIDTATVLRFFTTVALKVLARDPHFENYIVCNLYALRYFYFYVNLNLMVYLQFYTYLK